MKIKVEQLHKQRELKWQQLKLLKEQRLKGPAKPSKAPHVPGKQQCQGPQGRRPANPNEAARFAVGKGIATLPSLAAMARVIQNLESSKPSLLGWRGLHPSPAQLMIHQEDVVGRRLSSLVAFSLNGNWR